MLSCSFSCFFILLMACVSGLHLPRGAGGMFSPFAQHSLRPSKSQATGNATAVAVNQG